MSDASSEKQDQILANQAAIIANQAKLEEILANQVAIKSNQSKLDQILANQEEDPGQTRLAVGLAHQASFPNTRASDAALGSRPLVMV